jgi:hypothetical protein
VADSRLLIGLPALYTIHLLPNLAIWWQLQVPLSPMGLAEIGCTFAMIWTTAVRPGVTVISMAIPSGIYLSILRDVVIPLLLLLLFITVCCSHNLSQVLCIGRLGLLVLHSYFFKLQTPG